MRKFQRYSEEDLLLLKGFLESEIANIKVTNSIFNKARIFAWQMTIKELSEELAFKQKPADMLSAFFSFNRGEIELSP